MINVITSARMGVAGRTARVMLAAWALFVVTSGAGAAGAESDSNEPMLVYAPGRGVQIDNTGLGLGGYAQATLERPEGHGPSFSLEELSLFVLLDPSPRWHFFSETEFLDTLEIDERGRVGAADKPVVLNRLYLDYLHTAAINVRVGKFLTPFGIWNPIHAGPLVWTTSRPIATDETFFDSNVTGVMLYGHANAGALQLGYSAYGQATEQLLPESTDGRKNRRAGGGRLDLSTDGSWTLGFSSIGFDDGSMHRWRYVGGGDFRWQRDFLELWSELTVGTPLADGGGTDWGGYVQPTVPLVANLYAVCRYEHVHTGEIGDANLGVAGLAYRPWPTVVLKAEYRFSDNRADATAPGFAGQLAVLF